MALQFGEIICSIFNFLNTWLRINLYLILCYLSLNSEKEFSTMVQFCLNLNFAHKFFNKIFTHRKSQANPTFINFFCWLDLSKELKKLLGIYWTHTATSISNRNLNIFHLDLIILIIIILFKFRLWEIIIILFNNIKVWWNQPIFFKTDMHIDMSFTCILYCISNEIH